MPTIDHRAATGCRDGVVAEPGGLQRAAPSPVRGGAAFPYRPGRLTGSRDS